MSGLASMIGPHKEDLYLAFKGGFEKDAIEQFLHAMQTNPPQPGGETGPTLLLAVRALEQFFFDNGLTDPSKRQV